MEKTKTLIDPLGILSDGIVVKSQKHFDVGDGWDIILSGEEIKRPKSLRRVAITRAEINFNSEENIKMFYDLIKESDLRLSQVPDEQVMYDWQIVRRKGLLVRFGVAWYDENFYSQRKDAHLSEMHNRIFSQFGVKQETIRIEHIPL